ncbi:MAG TPA: FIST N-terminal domain-containing protein [Tepidisphaeraceae bacterium]|nr:FIST N-terminal domain-containing protein [Tepidisphaeraceae bacterium]
MRFASAVSENESTADAVDEVLAAAREAAIDADLTFLFFTPHHAAEARSITERLWRELDPQVMLGCSAEGVIGGDREVERAPGMSLLVGQLPGVRLHPFHIAADEWRDVLADREELLQRLAHGPETRAVIGFGDPFTTPTTPFLPALDAAAPGLPLIGGMASGARQPGENVLVRNDELLEDGFVGVSLSGAVEVTTVVSQGCRPVGRAMVVTRSRENVIEQLGGRPALTALREMVDDMSDADKELLGNGLLIGRAISEYRESFGRGDFLVRNLMGVDQNSGAIAVTDFVRVGQTVQFHVRDAGTATEDLALLLASQQSAEPAPGAALLFSCNGRGTRMFDQPCHDVSAARRAMPRTPVAGFFAAGELGPIGGKNFVHGHTASLALLRPRSS